MLSRSRGENPFFPDSFNSQPVITCYETKTLSLTAFLSFYALISQCCDLLTIFVFQSGSPDCCWVSASLPSCEHWTQSPPPPGKAQRCSPVRKEPADPLSYSNLNSSAVSLFSGKSVTNFQNVQRHVSLLRKMKYLIELSAQVSDL